MEKVFIWRNSSIAYTVFGNGPYPMVAFHGYGQDKSVYSALLDGFGDRYTLYAIDLPYHGNTLWKEPHELDYEELEELAVAFMKEIGVDELLSLVGYSIGGNYVLGLVHKCPHIIKEIWLIAADGLGPKPGFNFLTRTIPGRLFFRGFVWLPHPVFAIMWLVNSLKIIPERVIRFFRLSIDSREKRRALYDRWHSISRIRGHIRHVKAQIKLYDIPAYLIFGRNDGVISLRSAVHFKRDLPSARLLITDQGHQMLDPETNTYIRQMLDDTETP